MKWRVQELTTQALRDDDAVVWRVKVRLKQRDRTKVVRGVVWWAALYGDDSGLVWDRKELARDVRCRIDAPSSARNNMAETEMYSSTGGGAAIMFETYGATARQRSRWRGQCCWLNSEIC
jgi:hypothetical protein